MTSSASPFHFSKVQLFSEGDDFYAAAKKAIHEAKDEILFETYIFDFDSIGREFLEALAEARQRNVRVQLLVDGVGSIATLRPIHDFCSKYDIDFQVFHPPPFYATSFLLRRNGKTEAWLTRFFGKLQNFLKFMNKRDHRKMIVLDQRICFIGSYNISNVHSARFFGDQAWRDSGVEVHGESPAVSVIRAFQRTWLRSKDLDQPPLQFRFRERFVKKKNLHFSPFRFNDGMRDRMRVASDIRRRVNRAKQRILITNAYFLPRPAFLKALRKASRRGVFVGLCLPMKTDVWMVREAGRTMLRKLLADGVKIYEYKPRVLHAKTMVIDHWSTVGSRNLNYRSFFHDLEVDVELRDRQHVGQLVEQWEKDISESHPLTLNDLDQDSFLRRLVGRLVYLARYWM